MIPLKDDIPSETFPITTLMFIGANVAVFLYQLSLELSPEPGALRAAQDLVLEFGLVPCRLTAVCRIPEVAPHPVVTIFTSMFLHGGAFHLGGNMLYLWIFGNNVEDILGHGRFLLFYLLSGISAAVAQVAIGPSSSVPMVGASGAVSGVLGAYLLLFPQARVLILFTFFIFIRFIYVPAVLVLGFWIVVQFLNGLITYSAMTAGREPGGVAWFAHIGGFLAGMALLFVLRPRRGRRL